MPTWAGLPDSSVSEGEYTRVRVLQGPILWHISFSTGKIMLSYVILKGLHKYLAYVLLFEYLIFSEFLDIAGDRITNYKIQYENDVKFNCFMIGIKFFYISIQFVKVTHVQTRKSIKLEHTVKVIHKWNKDVIFLSRMIFEWYVDCLKFIIYDLGFWTEDGETILFSYSFKISLSYSKSLTRMCILGVKWSHLKWYKLLYSISMKQNGVKAKKITASDYSELLFLNISVDILCAEFMHF